MARYYPEDTLIQVSSVDVYDNHIYMLQDKIITVISNNGITTYGIDRSDGKQMSRMLVKDKTSIFVSQWEYPGQIFRYDTVEGTTETVAEGLNNPSFMSMIYTTDGDRYIVTEKMAHCIKIYNDTWKALYSFGGCRCINDGMFHCPRATVVTQRGTILVADSQNNRVSHYTLEGQFLSHVLTDLPYLPLGICYKYPYFWICMGAGELVKCFELAEL